MCRTWGHAILFERHGLERLVLSVYKAIEYQWEHGYPEAVGFPNIPHIAHQKLTATGFCSIFPKGCGGHDRLDLRDQRPV